MPPENDDFTWMHGLYHILAAAVAVGPPRSPIHVFPDQITDEPLYAVGMRDVIIYPGSGLNTGYIYEQVQGHFHAMHVERERLVATMTRVEFTSIDPRAPFDDDVDGDGNQFVPSAMLGRRIAANTGALYEWALAVVDAAFITANRVACERRLQEKDDAAFTHIGRVQDLLRNCVSGSAEMRRDAIEIIDRMQSIRDPKKGVPPWIRDAVLLRVKAVAPECNIAREEFWTTFWRMMMRFGDYHPIG